LAFYRARLAGMRSQGEYVVPDSNRMDAGNAMNILKVDGENIRPMASYGLLESCGQDRTSMRDDDGEFFADCAEYVPRISGRPIEWTN